MAADRGPLPGVTYPIGTLTVADIYPTHALVGTPTTLERTVPARVEAAAAAASGSITRTGIEADLMGQPAGWLLVGILVLLALAWWS
jgi:hypothetical protein